MALSLQFIFPLPNGLHARPASLLEAVTRRYLAGITLANRRSGASADVKSVLALIGLDTRHQDACELTVSGPDEREALAALTVFIRDTLPHCDDPLPAGGGAVAAPRLPAMLSAEAITAFFGTPVVSGIAAGRVVLAGGFQIPASLPQSGCADPAAEWETLAAALQRVIAYYDQRLAAAKNQLIRDLLQAHQAIARDPELSRQLHQAIAQNGRTAAGAIADTTAHFTDLLARSGSALLRERGLDIQDVAIHLLRQVYGAAAQTREIKLDAPAILLAESLTPGQFLALDRTFLRGLVLLHAGTTSHTVILARSFGLPTLTGAAVADAAALAGQEAVLDGFAGALLTQLTDTTRRYYAREQLRLIGRQEHLQAIAARAAAPAVRKIEIAANIATAGEAAAAFAAGAEGIGLFRTEMLFLDRESPPDEAEQFAAYREVLARAGERTVIIRTLDSGGDKPLDYLHLPAEDNPFLGFRAVRIYPRFEELFRTQIRALLRASVHGKLKLLVPMIAMLDEVRWVKRIIAEEQARCAAAGIPFAATMEVGAMIEVPAAAFIMDTLCQELDFFSIGTNDLLQYFTAADRANPNVAALYNPLQPAFLRLLKLVVDEAHKHGKWIGLCGEMGGHARWLPLLAGLGLDEISVPAPAIAQIKAELAGWPPAPCRQLLAAALNCATADEVAGLLRQASAQATVPLFAPELVLTGQTALTREEAVKLATDRLYVFGRTDDSRGLEQVVLNREKNCSTGFGFGFAIPHGQTDALRSDSLVLVKLNSPVSWNALDGQPVSVIFLLCVRASETVTPHLPILARLARRVMAPDFRARIQAENEPQALYALLQEYLKME